jgi:tyrosyl-tRNA synthetase
MATLLHQLEQRGLVEASTGAELSTALEKPLSVYIGFDPTADSLHLGNLLALVCLAWFQREGHQVVVVVGGATGMIGDPGGRSKERPLLTLEALERNVAGIKRDLMAVLEISGGSGPKPLILNNYDWLGRLSLLDFLREVGKVSRMGPMLSKEMVRTRLESDEGLSYTEFSYQLLQAYDYLHLYDEHGVTLQIGGSDQWGNITAGVELVRKLRGEGVHGLTFPLLTRSDGKKFGKSEEGAIWLSPERLSPYDFYQYLVRIPDADVIRLMRMLTFLPLGEVYEWQQRMQEKAYEANTAQKRLAEAVTELVHGKEALHAALQVTETMKPGAREASLSLQSLEMLAGQMPSLQLTPAEVVGVPIIELLIAAGLASSKGEGRRLIAGGGVALNNARVTESDKRMELADLIEGRLALLSVGKKRRVLLQVTADLQG